MLYLPSTLRCVAFFVLWALGFGLWALGLWAFGLWAWRVRVLGM